MYLLTGNKYECCGCTACEQVCLKSCIQMQQDEEGFFFPLIDRTNCIDCHLCEKSCPFSDNYTFHTTDNPDVYAAYDKENRVGSSSGGIFYTLAKYAIEERNGWVFGTAFDENLQLSHCGVNCMEDLDKLRGSKYLQSKMDDTYTKIKTLLKEGTFVLFVGTPCQVAGLRAFLRKRYENLLFADLVCHGTPSQKIFDEHKSYLENKHQAKLVSYQFRDGEAWGVCEIADFANPEKRSKLPSYELSPYLYSFMYAMTYRYSCYNCKFACVPRQGDITLADYWGVKEYFPQVDTSKGVSLVLLNTEIGIKIWNEIEQNCISFKSNIKDAAAHNGNLIHKSTEPRNRKDIYRRVAEEGYETVAKKDFKSPNAWKVKLLMYIDDSLLLKPLLSIYRKLK